MTTYEDDGRMEMGMDHEGDNTYLQKYIGKYYRRRQNEDTRLQSLSEKNPAPEDTNKVYVSHDDFPKGAIIKLLYPRQKNVKKYVCGQIQLHVTENGYIYKATWG